MQNASVRNLKRRNNMDPIEQQIAIAEACGWIPHPDNSKRENSIKSWHKGKVGNTECRFLEETRESCWGTTKGLPNYLNDLNAMHEAENAIMTGDLMDTTSIQYRYSHYLYNVVVPSNRQPFRAKASQRAEAFLKTLGLWKDEPQVKGDLK